MKALFIFIVLISSIFQDYTVIVDSEFAYQPFEKKLTEENLSDHFKVQFESYFETTESKHAPKLDTIYSYTYRDSFFEFVKAPNGSVFFSKAVIRDPELRMRDVYVGMSLNTFCDNFQLGQSRDSIYVVTDEEDLMSHAFWFEDERLIQASIINYVD